jgi:peroxiredoxin family protein
VQIHQHGEVIATGRIDMLAADGSVLWLHLAGGNERAIFLQSDGLRIYRSHRSAAN